MSYCSNRREESSRIFPSHLSGNILLQTSFFKTEVPSEFICGGNGLEGQPEGLDYDSVLLLLVLLFLLLLLSGCFLSQCYVSQASPKLLI